MECVACKGWVRIRKCYLYVIYCVGVGHIRNIDDSGGEWLE